MTLTGVVVGLGLTGAAVTAVVALVVAVRRVEAAPRVETAEPAVGILTAPAEPIGAEAGVFRTELRKLAIGDPTVPRRPAKPRTLHIYRTRRAFPGAPPQIPHGLTGAEFRNGNCTTCHERGGFSPRFGAYVPVTPHPEMGPCLQCHVGVDEITGVSLPNLDPNTICRQCHDPNAPRANPAAEWRTTIWPQLQPRVPGSPPPIPHDVAIRTNCVACHSGPAAVEEIRTPHPERTNCRQCHVTIDTGAENFVRTPAVAAGRPGDDQ